MQTAVVAILGLASMVIGLLLTLILPDIKLIGWGLIAFGIILVISAAIIDFRRVRGAVTSRRGKFSTSTGVVVAIFAGIIIFVNAISVNAYHRFDFTALSQFTLTSQTKDVLEKIETPITVKCFFTPTDEYGISIYGYGLLMEYRNFTNKLQIRIIDPDQNPEEAREYGIVDETLYQSIVFETGLGKYIVTPEELVYQAEHAFTNAILSVTGIEQKKIYFLSGHGEASISDNLIYVADALQTNLLIPLTLDIQTTGYIPDDCAVLVVAGPTKPMTEEEKSIISEYMDNDGYVFFMTNPDSPDDIAEILAPWGIGIKSGTIVEQDSYSSPNMNNILVNRTRNAFGLTTIYFPGATAIFEQAENFPSTMELLPLVLTTSNSWLENDYDPTEKAEYDEETEEKGPFYVGMVVEPSAVYDDDGNFVEYNDGPFIAVFGDSDFITDTNFINGNNGDMFLTIINAMQLGTDVVSIDSPVLTTRRLILSPEKESFLNISSIALLPAVVLIIGTVVWWRRR